MGKDINFSHLHVHSEYSLLDGMSKIPDIFDKVKLLGQSAVAITDHGSTSAMWEAQNYAEKVGIKHIFGTEFYYKRENDEKNGHLIVLAKNNKGLENIFKLQEYAYVDNFYRRPRIDFDKLVEYKEGLVVSSACLASTFSQYIMNGELSEAKAWAGKFKEEFGEDFYLEIQANSILEQHEVNKHTVMIGKELGIKVIATNDTHYTDKEDAYVHEVLLAMQVKKKMSDEKRFKFSTEDFWIKSNKEMLDTLIGISKEDAIESMNNTQEIVDKCNAKLVPSKHLPKYYNIPEGKTSRDLLIDELMKGARRVGRLPDKKYMKDVQKELNVIDSEGYSDYFLIVQDYVRSARERGESVGDGRGSASGAKTSYLMDITRIDPDKYDLLFERFMSPGRSPDIDTDFSNQQAVFEDLQSKYGENSVARIVTSNRLAVKGAIRNVLSTLDVEQKVIKNITKLVPDTAKTLREAYKQSNELLEIRKSMPDEFNIIEKLEGHISHEGQHAGGVVVYPNLSKYLPIKTVGANRNERIIAFDMDTIDELG